MRELLSIQFDWSAKAGERSRDVCDVMKSDRHFSITDSLSGGRRTTRKSPSPLAVKVHRARGAGYVWWRLGDRTRQSDGQAPPHRAFVRARARQVPGRCVVKL